MKPALTRPNRFGALQAMASATPNSNCSPLKKRAVVALRVVSLATRLSKICFNLLPSICAVPRSGSISQWIGTDSSPDSPATSSMSPAAPFTATRTFRPIRRARSSSTSPTRTSRKPSRWRTKRIHLSAAAPGLSVTSCTVSSTSRTRFALPAAPWIVEVLYITVSSGA